MARDIGRIGIWISETRFPAEAIGTFAAELEQLGFGALWIGGSPALPLTSARSALAATKRLVVGTGIFRVWDAEAAQVGEVWRGLEADFPGRFLLGLGVGHAPHVANYQKPYAKMASYLDELDAAGVPREVRVLAALGPKMIKLAGEQAGGVHPYLTTPAHTRSAREILGADSLLVPEQKLVLETDVATARAIARPVLTTPYLGLPNYLNNFRREGFTDADFADGGSDRLVDQLAAHGTAEQAVARVREHLDAGADQVAVQLLAADGKPLISQYAALAQGLSDQIG